MYQAREVVKKNNLDREQKESTKVSEIKKENPTPESKTTTKERDPS